MEPCFCKKLEKKIIQHEEVIAQLVSMIGVMNKSVISLIEHEQVTKALEKQTPSTTMSSH